MGEGPLVRAAATNGGPYALSRRWVDLPLAAVLVVAFLLVGSDAGRLTTEIRVLGAVIGAGFIAVYLFWAPRDHDVVDLLVVGGLVAFSVACATSSMPRLSFDPAVTAFAYAATFYVARRAVSTDEGRQLALIVLGTLGAAIAVLYLILWGAVWLRWFAVPGAGAPPLNLIVPTAQFSQIHVGMVVGMLMPAILLLARRPVIGLVGVAGVVASSAVLVMSGSRSVWLGLAAALLAGALAARGRVWRDAGRWLAFAALSVGALAIIAAPQLIARLATISTIEQRMTVWSLAISEWLDAPLAGHGPGTFSTAFLETGYNNLYNTYIPYAHNLPIQILFETGLLGAVAAMALCAAVVTGLRHNRRAWAPMAGLAFFAAAAFTEDPNQSSATVMVLIVWTSLLMPRPVPARRHANRALRVAIASAACVLAVAVGSTLAASWWYDRARVAAIDAHRDKVVAHLQTAVMLDPSFALYQRDLGSWLASQGDLLGARDHLDRAVSLAPADPAARRALALVALQDGDVGGAYAVANDALAVARLHVENALTLAYVETQTGDPRAAERALVEVVRVAPWVIAAPEWDRLFSAALKDDLIKEASRSWVASEEASSRNARARTWLAAFSSMPLPSDASLADSAEFALFECDFGSAADIYAAMRREEATEAQALQGMAMLAHASGGVTNDRISTLLSLRGRGLALQAFGGVIGHRAVTDYTKDVHTYSRLPILPGFGPVFPTEDSGLSVWLNDPVAAAESAAPRISLAQCR